MNKLKMADIEIFNSIEKELHRQQNTLEMIASENFNSPGVMEAMGSVFRIDQSQSLHTASPKIRIMAQCQSLQIVVRNGAGSAGSGVRAG